MFEVEYGKNTRIFNACQVNALNRRYFLKISKIFFQRQVRVLTSYKLKKKKLIILEIITYVRKICNFNFRFLN